MLLAALVWGGCTAGGQSVQQDRQGDWISALSPAERDAVPLIGFCDLPEHEGEVVRVRATYWVLEEYAGLNVTPPCDSVANVHLEHHDLWTETREHPEWPRFFEAHTYYWRLEAVVEVVGRYEADDPYGYGHGGSNDSQIDALALRIIEIREKESESE